VMDGQVRETQLFNLAGNPHEFLKEHGRKSVMETNLAAAPGYAEKLAEMESLLLAEMRRLNDPYRLWNQPDDGVERSKAESRPKKYRKKAQQAASFPGNVSEMSSRFPATSCPQRRASSSHSGSGFPPSWE
jgi:choline-sulfatase